MRLADDFPLRIGDTARRVRRFESGDIAAYRALAEDGGLRFGSGAESVPGPLLAGMISDLLGTSLPGLGTMWMKQTLEFGVPVPAGAEVEAAVTITRMNPDKGLVYLEAECRCGGESAVRGTSLVMVPDLAERALG